MSGAKNQTTMVILSKGNAVKFTAVTKRVFEQQIGCSCAPV